MEHARAPPAPPRRSSRPAPSQSGADATASSFPRRSSAVVLSSTVSLHIPRFGETSVLLRPFLVFQLNRHTGRASDSTLFKFSGRRAVTASLPKLLLGTLVSVASCRRFLDTPAFALDRTFRWHDQNPSTLCLLLLRATSRRAHTRGCPGYRARTRDTPGHRIG